MSQRQAIVFLLDATLSGQGLSIDATGVLMHLNPAEQQQPARPAAANWRKRS